MVLRIVLLIFLSFISSSVVAQQINGTQIDRGIQRPGIVPVNVPMITDATHLILIKIVAPAI